MKIVAIGSMPSDLELACFGTLSKCIKDGHEVHIIIAKDKLDWTQMKMETLGRVSEKIGVSQVYFTDRFDYNSVTQDNADVLRSFIKTIDPSLVIMPFWKAYNRKRKILAKTSLIACRGFGNILMYELEKNTNFRPTIYFVISGVEISIKTSCYAEYGRLASKPIVNRKANCFDLNLLTMKKYQLPLFPQTSTGLETSTSGAGTVLPHNYEQQLIFANGANSEIYIQENIRNDHHKKIGIKPSHKLYRQQLCMNVLVEVFDSHRMLLVDRDGF